MTTFDFEDDMLLMNHARLDLWVMKSRTAASPGYEEFRCYCNFVGKYIMPIIGRPGLRVCKDIGDSL